MRIITIVLLLCTCVAGWAQKKEISQAKTYIKSGKDFDKAEKLMTDLLSNNPENRQNEKIYLTWFQAVMKQYEAANEKLYLNQKYDTAAFFNLTRRLFMIAESLDSLDMVPDKKGRVKLRYREDHAEILNRLRPNLYYGGTYFIRREKYEQAYDLISCYLDCTEAPLFDQYDYNDKDSTLSEAAYWATYVGYVMKDGERTLHYLDMAVENETKAQYVMQYACEAYRWQNDEASYLTMLKRGFEAYPDYSYFFPRLADYYNSHERADSTLLIADEALKSNPNGELFLLAKSVALLNLERYDECVKVGERLIAQNDSLAEPYFTIATARLNQALALDKRNQPRVYKKTIQKLYMEARPYMEAYRKLAPTEKRKWAPALYRIYLNLNMGRQFEEIDKIMRKL